MNSIRHSYYRSLFAFAARSMLALAALISLAAVESGVAAAATSPYTPKITFTSGPATISSGGKAYLYWQTTNSSTCKASGGWQGSVSTGGGQWTGALTKTTQFVLTCTGTMGSATKSTTVTVTGTTAAAPTVKISASSSSLASGGSSTLTWSSTNATACSAAGAWSGAKAVSGSQSTGVLKATATYSLTCTGSGGSATQSATVTVTSTAAAPTVSLSATPSSITTGTTATLSWSSTNATGCTASGSWSGSKATSGSQTTGALTANTSYTLTCTGAGGSASKSAAITVTTATASTLAAKYPGDIGIGSDPAVVWNENFSESSVSAVTAKYSDVENPGGMSLVADIPAHNAASAKSISMISGGANSTTHLFTKLPKGSDEIYVRYYAKYVTKGPWHHVGMVFGGFNPALSYPQPKASQKPAGNDRFLIYYEPNSDAQSNNWTDFYNYWMQMHSYVANPVQGDYYGNELVNNPGLTTFDTNWHSYEIHLKLNTDMTSSAGAILELWIDDQPIIRYDDSGAIVGGGSDEAGGFWIKDKFCYLSDASSICAPYNPGSGYVKLNQQYRTTTALQTNFMWLENYNTYPTNNEVRYSNVVFATKRIGAIVP
jgi:hypothetical protein